GAVTGRVFDSLSDGPEVPPRPTLDVRDGGTDQLEELIGCCRIRDTQAIEQAVGGNHGTTGACAPSGTPTSVHKNAMRSIRPPARHAQDSGCGASVQMTDSL